MRPFVYKLTKSELHAVMTGGFATVAGSYIAILIEVGVRVLLVYHITINLLFHFVSLIHSNLSPSHFAHLTLCSPLVSLSPLSLSNAPLFTPGSKPTFSNKSIHHADTP